MMEVLATQRGFPIIKFSDRYRESCSLQISSLADDRCIWLGVDSVNPRILARDAFKYGIVTTETTGWVDYELPDEVALNSRMHLNQDQVKELLPHLIKFAETGEI